MRIPTIRGAPGFRIPGIALCLCAWSGTAAGETMSARDFTQLVKGLHSEIKDVWFLYEGEGRVFGKGQGAAGQPDDEVQSFQGTYAYRADGATLLDVFVHSARTDVPYRRSTVAALKGKKEEIDRIPDSVSNPPKRVSNSSQGAFYRSMSPERMLFIHYFHSFAAPADEDFVDEGWEEVAGHRCLRVKINLFPSAGFKETAGAKMMWNRLWIDMERGGHPLKVELWRGSDLWGRQEIELAEVPGPGGRRIWFPARGTSESFVGRGREGGSLASVSSGPLARETLSILTSSLRFNQNLPDKTFSVNYNGGLHDTPELKTQRLLFQSIKPPPQPKPEREPSDPESVQKRLDELLAQADKESERLDASSTVGTYRDWTLIGSIGLTGAGLIAVVCGLYFRRRWA